MRRFRFGYSMSRAETPAELVEAARRAEAGGYSTFLMADHIGILSPFPALTAVATATERLRVGTFVVANDFRSPALVAQEAATVDFLSDGRLELGMGAGWLASEYAAGGWAFDPAPVRIERLEEAVAIVSRLLAGETVTEDGEHYRVQELELYPEPPQGASLPILIGGNGTRLLGVAGRNADIVGFTGFALRKGGTEPTPTHWTEDGLADRIGVVRDAAGDRFAGIELNLLLQRAVVTDDSRGAAAEVAGEAGFDLEAVLATPFMQFGTPTEIATNLVGLRERLGVSYFTVFGARSEGFQQVVAELAGE